MQETTLAYIRRNGFTLMLHRTGKKHDPNSGKWIGIGGKMEMGETPDACMLREVYEETGLVPEAYEYRGVVDFSSGDWQERMHLYTVDSFGGREHACDEGELQWVRNEEVSCLPAWEGDRYFLEKLWNGSPFFHMKLVYDGEALVSVTEEPIRTK